MSSPIPWRKLNYRLHSWIGLACAGFLILTALTGSLLVFNYEIDAARGPVPSSLTLRSLDTIDTQVRAAFPDHSVKGYHLPTVTHSAVRATLSRDGETTLALLDPASGQILGQRTTPWKDVALAIHHMMLLGDWGNAILFLVGCGMILLAITGLWIHRRTLTASFRRPRFDRGWRTGFSDLHKALGVPLYLFLIVVGFTGATMNLPAFGRIAAGKPIPLGIHTAGGFTPAATSLDAALAAARREIPDFTPNYVGLPKPGALRVAIHGAVAGQEFFGPYSSWVWLDATSGEIQSVHDIRHLPWSEKWKSFIKPLHYGNFGGIALKALYSLAALGIAILSLTGLLIWRARQRKL